MSQQPTIPSPTTSSPTARHITIVASGSRGDVQPYVALGRGLKDAGYRVLLLSTDDFESLAQTAGLEFRSTGTSVESLLQSDEWRHTMERGNMLAILARMRSEMKKQAHETAQTLPSLIKDTDLVVTGMNIMTGVFSIAEKLDLPLVQAFVVPLTPTRAFAAPLMPVNSLGPLNRLSFHLMRQMMWQSFRVSDTTIRQEMGLPRSPQAGPFRALNRKQVPAIYGFSQHVPPPITDWPDHHHITGYWFLDPPADWQPSADLLDFLRAGPPPVYIGFGSMGTRDPEQAATLALKALALSGQRGILASGWGGFKSGDLPDTVYMIKSVPHTWLFPQMAAVVHHCGAGTAAAGLGAGVPTIPVPFSADQPFWGRRIAALGVGTPPIPRKHLTAERLAQAITRTVEDSAMRQRAAALGEQIRAEDGIARAVEVIKAAVQ